MPRGSSRRRRLPRSAPGAGTILRRRGRRKRGNFYAELEVTTDLAFDLDVRKLVAHVMRRLAEHFRDSWLQGQHPSGGRVPRLRPSSTADFNRGGGSTFFHNTGDSARSWYLGKISGGTLRAEGTLRPVIEAEGFPQFAFDFVLRAWARRGIRLQGTGGPVPSIVQRAMDEYLEMAVGDGVATPQDADTAAGSLINKG